MNICTVFVIVGFVVVFMVGVGIVVFAVDLFVFAILVKSALIVQQVVDCCVKVLIVFDKLVAVKIWFDDCLCFS